MATFKLRPNHLLIIAGAALLLVAFLFAITSLRAPTVHAPSALHNSVITLSDATLELMALKVAYEYGLQGEPIATRFERMSLAEWHSRTHSGTPDDEEVPVFVYVLRGEIIWRGPDGPRPGHTEPNRYNNIVIVLDARTGEMRAVAAAPNPADLPIELP